MNSTSTAINPHAAQPTSLVALGKSLWRNRRLIVQMTHREVVGRCKGSALGLAWSFFTQLIFLPLIILTLGLAWMLASLDVFLRDVGQTIGIVTTVMMFLAPAFYPITAVPEELRPVIMANPLTFIIEQAREVLIRGRPPNWTGLGLYTVVASAVAWAGYAWFQKTRKGFADVL